MAEQRSAKTGLAVTDALREIAGEIIAEEKTMAKIHERNDLLMMQKKREVKDHVGKFKTMGDGILALLQGSSRNIAGARKSIDYQSKSLYGKYFGRLVAELDKEGVLDRFKHMDEDLTRDVYREMGGVKIESKEAKIIAKTLESISDEVVARQNRAGAYIRRMPGYITRQTHDQAAIRALGRVGNNAASLFESYKTWKEFVLPLLDQERTFQGVDPEKILRNVHEGLYSGIHGPARDGDNLMGYTVMGDLSKKISQSRVLHFLGPDEAFEYNQALGIKDFKEQILHDLHVRTRSIALMENLGPRPQAALDQIIRELMDEARTREDAGKQVDSLRSWKIQAAMNEITGINEMSQNPTLSNIVGTTKVFVQMAKMGSVVLSSFADKAFMHAEMSYQGIKNLDILGKQLTTFFPRSQEQKQFLRLMGVAMDGMMGNALSRYSNHSTTSGWAHIVQKWFFDLNGLNLWTDANKAGTAELMSAHLAEYSHLPISRSKQIVAAAFRTPEGTIITGPSHPSIATFGEEHFTSELRSRATERGFITNTGEFLTQQEAENFSNIHDVHSRDITGKNLGKYWYKQFSKTDNPFLTGGLPEELVNVLSLYDITPSRWDAIRMTAVDHNGQRYITPDSIGNVPRETLIKLIEERGLRPTEPNILRERDALETSLRTYFTDRVDHAVPTPGVAEHKYMTLNTQAGTPLGEAVRLLSMFKSFPITVTRKILGREIFGRGADSFKDWILHDRKGQFCIAQLIAMGTIAGYLGGVARDALKGRTPKPLFMDDGSFAWKNLNDAAVRGGSLGILGDVLLNQYDAESNNFLKFAAGPVLGQFSDIGDITSKAEQGKDIRVPTEKLLLNNAPLINLFYIRPVLDYFILWNLQEMMTPGSLRRMESGVKSRYGQEYFVSPSERVTQ